MAAQFNQTPSTLFDAAAFYVDAGRLDPAAVDLETLERAVPNGHVPRLVADAVTVLHLDINSPLVGNLTMQGREDLGVLLGVVIGAGLERTGQLPEELSALADLAIRNGTEGSDA